MEKIISLLTRISELYNIPQWAVNSGAIAICIILIAFPFIARHLMRPKYYKFRELILFKVLWRWKYKKGDILGLWCYCPKCQGMLMCDDENCRSSADLQDKITYFICPQCGGHELGRVVGGDRRYALSLVKREIWRNIRDGSFNEVASATKDALKIYAELEESKAETDNNTPSNREDTVVPSSEDSMIEADNLPATNDTPEDDVALHVKEEGADAVVEITPQAEEGMESSGEDQSAQEIAEVISQEEIKKDGV